jgi:hypothetical protein
MLTRAAYRAFYVDHQQSVRSRYFSSKAALRAFLSSCRASGVKAWEPPNQNIITVVFPTQPVPAKPTKKTKGKVLSSVAMVRAQIAGLRPQA